MKSISKPSLDLMLSDTHQSFRVGFAAAFLWSAYLWMLPIGGITALRNLAFALLTCMTVWYIVRLHLRPILPLWIFWLPYTALALYSLTYSINPLFSLQELKGEVLGGMLACLLSTMWFGRESAFRLLLTILALGNMLMLSFVAYQLVVAEPFWNFPYSFLAGGVLLQEGAYHKLYNGVGSLSTYLITILPFLVAWALLGSTSRLLRRLLLLLTGMDIITLFMTGNRMSMIVLCMEILLFVIFTILRFRTNLPRKPLAFAIILLLTVFVFSAVQSSAKYSESDPRWQIWTVALSYITESPWSGNGFGRTIMAQGDTGFVAATAGMTHAHNVLINQSLQMGIPGAFTFLLLFAGVLGALWPRDGSQKDLKQWIWATAASTMVIGVILKSMTDDFFVNHLSSLFWILVGASIGLLHNAQATNRNYPVTNAVH